VCSPSAENCSEGANSKVRSSTSSSSSNGIWQWHWHSMIHHALG
jgi:hypothetical protein